MKTFIKQIEKACKNYKYFNVVRTMQIKDTYENTKVAIVSIVDDDNEGHHRIYYKYQNMKNIKYIGHYINLYNEKGEIIHNGYKEACEEFQKFAY